MPVAIMAGTEDRIANIDRQSARRDVRCQLVMLCGLLGAVADVVEIWMTLSSAFSGYRVMRQRQAFADPS